MSRIISDGFCSALNSLRHEVHSLVISSDLNLVRAPAIVLYIWTDAFGSYSACTLEVKKRESKYFSTFSGYNVFSVRSAEIKNGIAFCFSKLNEATFGG